MASLLLSLPLAGVARAGTQSFDFSGHVQSSGGTQWIIHKMDVAKAGVLTATLNWATTSANLNMFLLDANGNTKAHAASANRPEKITHSLGTNGLWKIRVSANSGSTNYTLHVDIESGNSAPNAVNDSVSTKKNTTLTLSPLTNDTDPNKDPLSLGTIGTPANGGSATPNGNSIIYTPATDFVGTDTFSYDACDNASPQLCDTAAVIVTVNDPGATNGSTQSFDFNGHVRSSGGTQWIIHKMDPVTTAGKLTATLSWPNASANLNMFLLDANGNTKAQAASANRPEKISYTLPTNGLWKIRVSAKSGGSDYTLHVDVVSGNSAPHAVNDSGATEQNTALTVSPLSNDTDPNNDPLSLGAIGNPSNGGTATPSGNSIVYTPALDFVGTETFTYEACDNASPSLCDTATVSLEVTQPRTTNAAPVANDDSATTDTNSTVNVSVLINDTDADGDQLTPALDAPPAHGTATINGNGTIRYEATGWTGTDSFTYHVCDDWTTPACSGIATVSVTVSAAPVGDGLLLHAPEFMTTRHTLTLEQALQQARDFHVISSGDVSLYKKYIPQMRAAAQEAGHSLLILQYINGTFHLKNEVANVTDENLFMHTKDGNRIQSKDFGNTLANIYHPQWVQSRINTCEAKIAQSGGVDGCFLDTMGLAPIRPTYVVPGVPWNESTGAAYTGAQWLDGTTNIAREVRNGLGGKKVFVNGLLNGSYYFDPAAPTKRLIDAADGGMIEILFRPPNTGVTAYPNETKWKADVDMLAAAAGRNNKTLITTTKVWMPGTQAQYDAWHRYSVASFLMGTTGHEYFNFRLDKNMTTKDRYAGVNVGTHTGGYAKVGGVYQRSFTNGVVIVNPTKNAVTVNLGRQYRTLEGNVVNGSISIPANSGDVYVNH